MAITFDTQTLVDTNKRSVIKLVGLFDGSGQETANVKIIGSTLFGALAQDTNNAILVANGGVARTNYNYAVERITGTISTGYLQMQWTGGTPRTIATLSGDFDWNMQENIAPIPNNAVGPTGNIMFTTVGTAAQSHYCVTLTLHKGPNQANVACDFNMGQIGKPSDFNFGTYAVRP